jgi:UDP-glucose 4-epimerase
MAKVFITGGAGFVGSRIVRQFLEVNYDVYVYDTFQQYLFPSPDAKQHNLMTRLAGIIDKIEVIRGNTLNKDHLRRTINRISPDIIIHTASLPLANIAIDNTEEAFESILTSTFNLLEVLRDFDKKCRLVYLSSSMVYGDFQTETVSEEHPTNPKDIYGSIKLAGEILVSAYRKRHEIDTSIVRPSAVYGPYDANQRVIQKFVASALKGEKITVDGDGSSRLDFTYVDDTAQAIFKVSTHENGAGEIFNVTRGDARSLKDVIDIMYNHIDNFEIEYRPMPDYMPKRGTLDVTKAKNLVDYLPQYNLEEALPAYIEHLKTHII